jgi:RNA polymerase sigma-70 factor, ECF subfamily
MDGTSAKEPWDSVAIVNGIHDGDRTAEAQLFNRYRRGVVLMLRRRIDPSLAEDLAHDALTEALRILRSRKLDAPEQLSAFIHAIAQNLVRNHSRKRIRQRTDPDTEAVEAVLDSSRDPEVIAARASLAAAVRKLLAALPIERDREVLIRFYLDEHNKPDICRDLQISQDHFDRVIHRARQRLRALIEQNASGTKLGDLLLALVAMSCILTLIT